MYIGVPADALQTRSGNDGVATVIAFSGEAKAAAGPRKKLLDRLRDSGPGPVHERFSRHSFRECGVFRRAHFRRSDDGRVHCSLGGVVGFFLLEDLFFFDLEPLWCLELESRMKR